MVYWHVENDSESCGIATININAYYMKRSLAKVDLNLLRALHSLLEERSVTRAAKRLFVTQSGMSKSLNRLREMFDDPLLLRGAEGMVLTPRARELVTQLEQIFDKIENCFMSPNFDPSSVKGLIRIAAPEQFAIIAVAELLVRLHEKAPELAVDSQHLMDNHLEMLAAGQLDFVVCMEQHYPKDFITRNIYVSAPMLWFRNGHPLAKKGNLDLADICAYPQIAFRTQNTAREDIRAILQAIAAAGLEGKMILDTSHLFVAIDVLIKTDAMMLAPNYLSRLSILQDAITARPIAHIPVFDRFRTSLLLVQHKRTLNSPLHRWIADEIASTFLTAGDQPT